MAGAVGAIAGEDAASPDWRLHTWVRSIASVDRSDQFILPGQNPYPTYVARADDISIATSASHILQIMGDGTNYTRLVGYTVTMTGDRAASDAVVDVVLVRLSTAGTGGSAVTPVAHDAADAYAGAGMTLPSSKGTEGATLHRFWLNIPTAFPAGAPWVPVRWQASRWTKPIVFGTGTGSGLAWKVVTGIAACTVSITAEIVITPYL